MVKGIDPTSHEPVYLQIAAHLKGLIQSGKFGPGDRLPTERQLGEEFGVARGTVREATRELQHQGLLEIQHGRGTFVRSRPPVRRLAGDRFARRHRDAGKAAYLAEMEGRKPEVEVLEIATLPSPPEIASRLQLSPGTPVLSRRRIYRADGGNPMEIATSYIPVGLAENTPITEENTGPGGIYARIEEQGFHLTRFVEDVCKRAPSSQEKRALELAGSVPVIHLIRTAYAVKNAGDAEIAVEVCDTVMAADCYQLSYELPAQ